MKCNSKKFLNLIFLVETENTFLNKTNVRADKKSSVGSWSVSQSYQK